MKLAFLENINFSSVLKRFPVPILISTIIGVLSILLVEEIIERDSETFRIIVKLFHVLLLLFASSALLSILRINNAWVKQRYWICVAVLFLIAGLYYFLLPHYPILKHAIQTIGMVGVIHLLITVLPFWKNEDLKQYWAYNKTLLLLFIEASLYTLFIFFALSVALVALDKLFGISFEPLEIYGDLWVVLLSFFHPLYFFSRFPKDLVFTNSELESSLPFRVFARRILIPIVILYGVILLAYVIKIIGLWSWPRGWVSNMVLWFSVVGTLAYLLNYIKLDEKENNIIRAFKKYYFHFQALMSIVLILAVYKRISEYGVTEPRYIVASLGVWLFFISSYFVISKRDNIKWIPGSLAFFIIIGTVGPFNMHHATLKSQFSRFTKELVAADILKDGVLHKAGNLSDEMKIKLSQGLRVLSDRNALHTLKKFESIQLLLPQDTLTNGDVVSPLHFRHSRYSNSDAVAYAKALNIPYKPYFHHDGSAQHFNLHTPSMFSIDVGDYNRIVQLRTYSNNTVKNQADHFYLSSEGNLLMYTDPNGSLYEIPLESLIQKYESEFFVQSPLDSLAYETRSGNLVFKFIFQNLGGTKREGKYLFEHMDGVVLIKYL